MKEFKVVKNYRNNDNLRLSFNELAKKTFGIDFEDWYQNGYWGDNYNPYSIEINGKVIANISVNITNYILNGNKKHFIQLGTVMTEEKYRNQGLIRQIMKEIEDDYMKDIDGIYLFANDSVLDFYPKFGFHKATEYQYCKNVSINKEGSMVKVSTKEKIELNKLEEVIKYSVHYGGFNLIENSGLIMFYVTKFMQENVYYDNNQGVYVIAEIDGEELFIHNIFSEKRLDIEKVIEAFGKGIKKVSLRFTPDIIEGYTVSDVKEEDTTLFIKGKGFCDFEESRLMFPTLAHA